MVQQILYWFLFINIEPYNPSVKISTQYQFPQYSPANSILFEGKNLISSFDRK